VRKSLQQYSSKENSGEQRQPDQKASQLLSSTH
jgi:hypothetical protein